VPQYLIVILRQLPRRQANAEARQLTFVLRDRAWRDECQAPSIQIIQISVESLIAEGPQPGTAGGHHIRLLDQARPATVELKKMFHFDRGSCRARNLLCKDLGKIAPRLRRNKEHAISEAEQIADEFDELIENKHAIAVIVVQRHHQTHSDFLRLLLLQRSHERLLQLPFLLIRGSLVVLRVDGLVHVHIREVVLPLPKNVAIPRAFARHGRSCRRRAEEVPRWSVERAGSSCRRASEEAAASLCASEEAAASRSRRASEEAGGWRRCASEEPAASSSRRTSEEAAASSSRRASEEAGGRRRRTSEEARTLHVGGKCVGPGWCRRASKEAWSCSAAEGGHVRAVAQWPVAQSGLRSGRSLLSRVHDAEAAAVKHTRARSRAHTLRTP